MYLVKLKHICQDFIREFILNHFYLSAHSKFKLFMANNIFDVKNMN